MSGSSGYSFETSPSAPKCEDLVIRTQLASPDPEVLSNVRAGDILSVHLLSAVGPIQAMTNEGRIAGAILTANPTQLINCINGGTVYQAKVQGINGGDCQVIIYCPNR